MDQYRKQKFYHAGLVICQQPEELLSYSHCIRFTSARRNRLKHLCTIASWRAIKLMVGWIMVILFVLWLASLFSLSTFPENPLKFFFTKKTRKKVKTKSKKSLNVDDDEKPTPPSICFEELYEFSRWPKFTNGRPKTNVFYQGRTYTYEKLPDFPQKKSRKPKTKTRTKIKPMKKKVTTSVSHDLSLIHISEPTRPY